MKSDSFNYYCVDCKTNPATYASMTFGILICEKCAHEHRTVLGMEKSYVKSLGEFWDNYQLRFIEVGIGGNR